MPGRQWCLEQRSPSALRDRAQCRRVRVVLQQVTGLRQCAIGPGEHGARVWQGRLRKLRVREPAESLRYRETRLCGADRSAEQLVPRQPTEPGVDGAEHGDRARGSRRTTARDRIRIRERLCLLVQEHFRRGTGRGRFAAIECRDLAGLRVEIQQERPAAKSRTLGLDEPEHGLHGDGSIGRAAAGTQHAETRFNGEGIGRGDPCAHDTCGGCDRLCGRRGRIRRRAASGGRP